LYSAESAPAGATRRGDRGFRISRWKKPCAPSRGGAKIVSLAPGVIDTDMQVQLRGAEADMFPDRARFERLKAQGQLDTPESAAAKVLAYLARPDFGNNAVADVRDA
jgi:NAD(P)-dependent dehydrogenase (short-subunit alcohol dehydrogenase family)